MATFVKSVTVAIDSTANGTFNVWKCPDDALGGGVTVLEAFITGAGTITSAVYTATDVGTPVINGTIVASAAATVAVGVPLALTVADAWIDGGEWVKYAMTAGSALASSFLIFNYTDGR